MASPYQHLSKILPRPLAVALGRLGPPDTKIKHFIYYPTRGMLRAVKLGLAECYTRDSQGACAYRRTAEGERKFQEYEAARTAPWTKK